MSLIKERQYDILGIPIHCVTLWSSFYNLNQKRRYNFDEQVYCRSMNELSVNF